MNAWRAPFGFAVQMWLSAVLADYTAAIISLAAYAQPQSAFTIATAQRDDFLRLKGAVEEIDYYMQNYGILTRPYGP